MTKLRNIQTALETIVAETDDDYVHRAAVEALEDIEALEDPYTQRVRRFHDALRERGNENYLTVIADAFGPGDLPVPADTPHEAAALLAEVTAERNRLFWAAFLAEESGEVASCLTSGEPPADFREEVADVLILCHAIADCFEFDMIQAFHEKMDENDEKPKRQEGTGKLPSEARDEWRSAGEDDDD